ncbi:MAG: hypothetical protein LUD27_02345 [Clostridia bacterium]|nr:hypothetical protein [Clostridia bacterium]
MSYEKIIVLIDRFCLKKIMFHPFFRNKQKSKSYANWAISEILERVGRFKNEPEIDIYVIIDDFVMTMTDMLCIKYFAGFNTARRTALYLKQYLNNFEGGLY